MRRLGWLSLLCRAVVGGILLWAGLSKAFDHQAVILSVDAYDILPQSLVEPVASALPWLEILLGAFLLAGLFVLFSAVGASVLTAMFIVALAQAKARGLPIDCGCFGASGTGTGITWWDIFRDMALLAATLLLVWRPAGPLMLDSLLEAKEEIRT
jgi:uncharacterized membrane protein YphA (DoxX/SURF4 family)